MKQTNIFGLGILVIGLASCQVKLDELAEPSVSEATETSIVGIWSTNCMEDSSDSYIKSFEVKDDVLTMATLHYSGTRTCEQAKLSHTIMYSGAYSASGDSTAVSGGKNYQLQLSVVVAVPNTADSVSFLNDGAVCGSTTWALNQAGLLSGCNAGIDYDYSQVALNTTHYGVFKIIAAATPNILQFEADCTIAGYQGLCPSASDRPATLGGTSYFRR